MPPAAEQVFGSALPKAVRYSELLRSDAVVRGLIGPHEAARIWTRHLLNSAVVEELVPAGAYVVDVGSGAGLPGIPLALARPDVRVTLLEPLQRRVRFLEETIDALDLGDRVEVVRGRAEEPAIRARLPLSTAVVVRAVAPLDRVVRWCLPLVEPDGWVLAIKGQRALQELAEHTIAVRRAGGVRTELATCGRGIIDPPTVVIRVQRGPEERGAKQR